MTRARGCPFLYRNFTFVGNFPFLHAYLAPRGLQVTFNQIRLFENQTRALAGSSTGCSLILYRTRWPLRFLLRAHA